MGGAEGVKGEQLGGVVFEEEVQQFREERKFEYFSTFIERNILFVWTCNSQLFTPRSSIGRTWLSSSTLPIS